MEKPFSQPIEVQEIELDIKTFTNWYQKLGDFFEDLGLPNLIQNGKNSKASVFWTSFISNKAI